MLRNEAKACGVQCGNAIQDIQRLAMPNGICDVHFGSDCIVARREKCLLTSQSQRSAVCIV
jgi:hypothetical protein